MKRRAYQIAGLKGLRTHRSFFLLWARQRGKSTMLSEGALDEMTGTPGRLVTYASASLLLGREIILKEALVLQRAISEMSHVANQAGLKLETANAQTHKAVLMPSPDDFAELFESQRLELRIWHDKTRFSRTQVIAPNPATARGWSGTVMLDEFGFIRDFRDLWEAVEPIISSDRSFKFIGATTPPRDDAHYSYELTAPPRGTTFPINPEGNWYTSEVGELVHRVDIFDSHAAGQKIYDRRTGQEMTPEEHFKRAEDKDAWRRNYKVEHVLGGTAACGLVELHNAQSKGEERGCRFVQVDCDADFDVAMAHLRERLQPSRAIGLGWDLATTEKETSNPSSLTIAERNGVETDLRLVLAWKTKDPAVQRERVGRVLAEIRAKGSRARRLCIDASNERLFAAEMAKELSGQVPVELVVAGERVQVPGREEPTNYKTLEGDLLVGALNDNRLAIPPERYVRDDWRLVRKEGGRFECVADGEGRHGDTFDSSKHALWALASNAGNVTAENIQ